MQWGSQRHLGCCKRKRACHRSNSAEIHSVLGHHWIAFCTTIRFGCPFEKTKIDHLFWNLKLIKISDEAGKSAAYSMEIMTATVQFFGKWAGRNWLSIRSSHIPGTKHNFWTDSLLIRGLLHNHGNSLIYGSIILFTFEEVEEKHEHLPLYRIPNQSDLAHLMTIARWERRSAMAIMKILERGDLWSLGMRKLDDKWAKRTGVDHSARPLGRRMRTERVKITNCSSFNLVIYNN